MENERGTPPHIVTRVQELLGSIDLDPCSDQHFNENVGAPTYYTEIEEGLTKPWKGRVFCNPPGAKKGTRASWLPWWESVVRHHQDTGQACVYLAYNTNQLFVSKRRATRSMFEYPVVWFYERLQYLEKHTLKPSEGRGWYYSALVYLPPKDELSGTTLNRLRAIFDGVGQVQMPYCHFDEAVSCHHGHPDTREV